MQGGSDLGSGSGSGSGVGAIANDHPDWRLELQPGARSRIVNKIMDTLKRHLPTPEPYGLSELQKIAVRLEEKIYSSAISQPDYLRKISLKMLSMETKSPPVLNPALPNQEERSQLGFIDPNFTAMQGNSALCSGSGSGSGSGAGADPNANPDWRLQLQPDARQRIVNKIMVTLKRHLPVQVPDALSELQKIAVRFEEKIYSAAINQPDYLRKISLKMLSMETKTQPILNPALPNQEGVGMTSPQSGPYLGHSLATPQSINQPPASRQQQRQPLIQGFPSTPSSVGGGPSGATIPAMSGPSISNNNPMSVPGGTTISLPTDVHLNNQRRQPPQQLTPQNQMLYQQQLAMLQKLQKQQQQPTQMQMSLALARGSGIMPAELTGGMQQQLAWQGGLIQQQLLMRQQQQQPQPTMQNPTIPIEQMNNATDLQQQHLQLQQNQMQQNQFQTHQMQFEERIYNAASSQDASKRIRCRKNIVEKSRKCRICGDCSHKRRIPN